MPIRSDGQREGRRRRVLRDDRSANQNDETPAAESRQRKTRAKQGGKRAYATEARRENQPVITDFVPQRNWTVCVVFLLGLCLVAATQSLYSIALHPPGILTAADVSAFKLAGPSTVSSWLCAFFLGIGSAVAFVVYLIRRHRLDDYRASYRWWLVTAAILLLASLNASTHLHELVPTLMVHWTGKPLVAGGSVWIEIVLGSTLALLALRLSLEMRGSRRAVAALGMALLGFTLLSVARHTNLLSDSAVLAEMLSAALMQSSTLMVVMAFILYGRHVYLEAHGQAAAATKRKTSPAKKRSASSETASRTRARSSRKQTSNATPSTPTPAKEDAGSPAEQEDAEETIDFQSMSKSERRRLRKQQRRERQAA